MYSPIVTKVSFIFGFHGMDPFDNEGKRLVIVKWY